MMYECIQSRRSQARAFDSVVGSVYCLYNHEHQVRSSCEELLLIIRDIETMCKEFTRVGIFTSGLR